MGWGRGGLINKIFFFFSPEEEKNIFIYYLKNLNIFFFFFLLPKKKKKKYSLFFCSKTGTASIKPFLPHLYHCSMLGNPGLREVVGEGGHHLLVAAVSTPKLLVSHDNPISFFRSKLSHVLIWKSKFEKK